ncbi:MAG: diaminopimelate epimerase [Thermoflavifilum sp.]|nr:diaminopimelate epimerase [Thermoflavifilum sp.]
MQISFTKYEGAGNDFILIDNRDAHLELKTEQIRWLCDRHFGVGADGLILLLSAEGFDFSMQYFNADGRESTMCGNGGRCIVDFAAQLNLWTQKCRFLAIDGPHEAYRMENGWIALRMKDVLQIERGYDTAILNTGSPHLVKYTDHLDQLDVVAEGRKIRYSERFAREGINVNFIEYGQDALLIRTYERGVENETLACGTGITAAALLAAGHEAREYRIPVQARGGRLEVRFRKINDQHFTDIWLCGPATRVFNGEIQLGEPDAIPPAFKEFLQSS